MQAPDRTAQRDLIFDFVAMTLNGVPSLDRCRV
jgi:hypothetical protein